MTLLRLQSWLATLWAGMTIAVGGVAAPSLFFALEREMAGKGAGQIFALEARISLALAMVLYIMERRRVRDQAESTGRHQALSANLILVLGVLFLTVFGEFALHPAIEAAKAGQPTRLSFGALHGISATLYWVKAALLLALSWRLSGVVRPVARQ